MGAGEGLTPARSGGAAGAPPVACPGFDVDALRLKGVTALLASAFANPPQWLFGLLRALLPNLCLPTWIYLTRYLPFPRLPLWVLVTRREDVAEVLARHDVFNVPWVEETKFLNDGKKNGTNFVLGLDGGDEYNRQLKFLMAAFARDDVADFVAPLSRKSAREIVAGAGGKLDAIPDLITAVALQVCRHYYGVAIPVRKREAFAQWTIAISGYLFGPPFDRERPGVKPTVEAGAACVRALVDKSIRRAIGRARAHPLAPPRTVIERLARQHRIRPGEMTEEVMRAFMIGMIVGFVPTNTVAAGHILDVLLSRPDFLSAARDAALAGDDERLARCLFEAMRWKPLNPGPWRICAQDCTIASGTWRAKRIRKGTYVLASTQSAMFDPRHVREPQRFDPARAASDSMLFGYGLHWCAGRYIAQAHVTHTLKALLLRPGLRRARGAAGRLRLLGLFPEHLSVEYS